MTDKQSLPWGDDTLSMFFKDADYNYRVSVSNLPSVYALLKQVHDTFCHVETTIEKDDREDLLIPRFLFVRAHSSYLAAIRLGMSGQLSEAYAIFRVGIEQAWYALHIARDPNPPERGTIWLCRNDDEHCKEKCRKEFTVRHVLLTHKAIDPTTAKQLHELYETVIDFGAHPNQKGLLAFLKNSKKEKSINYQMGILYPDFVPLVLTLRLSVVVAVGVLKIFQLIFPERFKIMSLDEEIKTLVHELNTAFKKYVSTS
jgi:hypothetical protein